MDFLLLTLYTAAMRNIVIIAHNLRSSHNVGSLLRTGDGLGVQQVHLTGYTPYPLSTQDSRLPHLAAKINAAITKTALGAEKTIAWEHAQNIENVIESLRKANYVIAALEQTEDATDRPNYTPPQKIAMLVGREVGGIEPEVLQVEDVHIASPMFGKKESFNVVQAAAMALFYCRFS